jgi:hypothetical protein
MVAPLCRWLLWRLCAGPPLPGGVGAPLPADPLS